MNVLTKRFLCGLAVCGAVAGQAQAQESGTVRISDDFSPETSGSEVPGVATFSAPLPEPAAFGAGPTPGNQVPPGFRSVDEIFNPIFRVDARGGQLYGYDEGYTSVGGFLPFFRDENSLIFTDIRGLMTNGGKGGANVGVGYRQFVPELDRIFGVSGWYDFDNGHREAFNQFGISFESIGRYLDWRVNGYLPVEDNEQVSNQILGAAGFQGNFILLNRGRSVDSAYKGFDTEIGGPFPILGRYGMSGYVGMYYYANTDVGSFTGVSGRFQQRVNEDLTINVTLTDDHTFGTNAQIQVIADIPNGFPSRWAREKRVRDRLRDPVMRNYRVTVEERLLVSQEFAIDPEDGNPYFVSHINPNLAGPGNGTFENQFSSLANYTALQANKGDVDFIYVTPRTDGTSTNLNTGITLINPAAGGDTQRLWSTSVTHTVAIDPSQGGGTFQMPGFTGGALPVLTNTTPGDVVTLTTGDVRFNVSGFDIQAQPGTNGIAGINNQDVVVDRNTISGGVNGVLLSNLTGTGTAGSVFSSNTFRNNTVDGVFIDTAGPLEVAVTDNFAFGNGDDGFQMQSNGGGQLQGVISGNSTIGASRNGDDGFVLTANGGNINFNNPASGFAITDNVFSQNNGDGLALEITGAGGNLDANIFANTFANNTDGVVGTDSNGLHFEAVAGTANLIVGSTDPTVARNQFTGNEDSGMLLEAAGTTVLAATVVNNNATGNTNGFAITQDGTATVGTLANPIIVTGNNASANQNGFLFATDGDAGAPIMQVSSFDNIAIQNTVAGIAIQGSDDGRMNFESNRDITGNAILGGNTGDGVNLALTQNSIVTAQFNNLTSSQNTGDGLDGSAADNSFLTVGIASPDDPDFNVAPLPVGNQSTLQNNANGIVLGSTINGKVNGFFDQVAATNNAGNGLQINRADASLMEVSITDSNTTNTRLSSFSNNGNDGIQFNYTGSDPSDPNQPVTTNFLAANPNSANFLTISNTQVNLNTGNGLETNGDADAVLLTNLQTSTFNQNTANGISVTTDSASGFGDIAGGIRSTFDNITVQQNTGDGIQFNALDGLGVGSQILAEINSVTGQSTIRGNGDDGIAILVGSVDPVGTTGAGIADILVQGDGLLAGNRTVIESNVGDGISGLLNGDEIILTVNDTLIGGTGALPTTPNAIVGRPNAGNGIAFSGSGASTLNVGLAGVNTTIQNNGQNGILIDTSDLQIIDIENTLIVGNQGDGIELSISGGQTSLQMQNSILRGNGGHGAFLDFFGFNFNNITFDTNTIESNGLHGVFLNTNAGPGVTAGPNGSTAVGASGQLNGYRWFNVNLPQPTAPVDTPFDSDAFFLASAAAANNGNNANNLPAGANNPIGTAYSNFLSTAADSITNFDFFDNTVQFNGASGVDGDGLFINVSTNSLVRADIGGAAVGAGLGQGNTFTGNRQSDFRTASFLRTDAAGNVIAKPVSVARAAPAADTIYLDAAAQMDLRFFNNTGNSINPNTANAVYAGEFRLQNSTPRFAQLFQMEGSAAVINANNGFSTLGTPQLVGTVLDGQGLFTPTANDGIFPNLAFPVNYATNPGNPFSP